MFMQTTKYDTKDFGNFLVLTGFPIFLNRYTESQGTEILGFHVRMIAFRKRCLKYQWEDPKIGCGAFSRFAPTIKISRETFGAK